MNMQLTLNLTEAIWPNHVKKPYENLLYATQQILTSNDREEILAAIAKIESLEKGVMIAWAECTTDRNPGLMDNVLNNVITLEPHMHTYLRRVLAAA